MIKNDIVYIYIYCSRPVCFQMKLPHYFQSICTAYNADTTSSYPAINSLQGLTVGNCRLKKDLPWLDSSFYGINDVFLFLVSFFFFLMRTSCILKHLFLLRQTTFDPRGRKQSNTTEGIWRAKLLVQIIDCSETVAQLGNKFPQEVPWAVTEVLSCVTQDWAYLFGLNRSAFSFICYFLLIFNGGKMYCPHWLIDLLRAGV